eukprot:173501_1
MSSSDVRTMVHVVANGNLNMQNTISRSHQNTIMPYTFDNAISPLTHQNTMNIDKRTKWSKQRQIGFDRCGYPKIGIRWNLKAMWLTYYPAKKKESTIQRQVDTTTCKPRQGWGLWRSMNHIYQEIQYLPRRLTKEHIYSLIPNQRPCVYELVDVLCTKYNEYITMDAFLLKTKRNPNLITYNKEPTVAVRPPSVPTHVY